MKTGTPGGDTSHPGVAVHGGSGVSFGVIEQLRRRVPNGMLELAHRPRPGNFGLLIVAKKRSALTRLHDAFRDAPSISAILPWSREAGAIPCSMCVCRC